MEGGAGGIISPGHADARPGETIPRHLRNYQETFESILDALVEGVARGKSYREVAKDMRDAMGMEYDRSLLIARTEINRSYRLANAEQYRRSGVVEKVLRLCYKPTACFACLMLDGEECPNGVCDDHPNGKCMTIVTTTGGITPEWQTGSEWLEEQSPENQRRIMGAGRYELWKNESVSPRFMVWMKPNPVWGGSPPVKTFDMMRDQGLTNDQRNGVQINNSLKSVTGVDEKGKPLHSTTKEIQEDQSFENLKKIFVKKHVLEEYPRIILDDSFGNYPLEIQKDIAEGFLWAKKDFNIKFWPESVTRVSLPNNVLGDYNNHDKCFTGRHIDEIINNYPSSEWDDLFKSLMWEFNIPWRKL